MAFAATLKMPGAAAYTETSSLKHQLPAPRPIGPARFSSLLAHLRSAEVQEFNFFLPNDVERIWSMEGIASSAWVSSGEVGGPLEMEAPPVPMYG